MHTQKLFDLSGKTALVTGGGHGIGRHLCIGLAEAGADIIIVGRKAEPLHETMSVIKTLGRNAWVIQADIADTAAIDQLMKEVLAKVKRLDILVNNAGFAWAQPTLDYSMQGWDKVFNLNVRGLFYLSQQAAIHMKEHRSGNIINISSISAWRNSTDDEEPVIAYNASKGAVVSLTRDMAVKLAQHNIRVNSIAPGSFRSTMMASAKNDDNKIKNLEMKIPQKRSGYEDDIKGVVVFLASAAAAYITGETIVVDGGWSCV
jgi:NAD(P)-dependent dehydrogenase (short-subunit alcohol dehydrogenase family)